jgi:hypothetical protein
MSEPESGATPRGPSRKSLARAAAWTFVGAAAVTILFVLPAEYGVDPTGLGEKLGLTRFQSAAAPDLQATPRIVEGRFPEIHPEDPFDFYEPDTLGDPFSRSQQGEFRTASMVIDLEAFEQVEVKAVMRQGDGLVYAWKLLEGETVYSDFHADPTEKDGYPDEYWIRYLETEEPAASGSLIAPFDGNHGWYWLNIEENPVSIELEVRGYWESLEEIMRSFQ